MQEVPIKVQPLLTELTEKPSKFRACTRVQIATLFPREHRPDETGCLTPFRWWRRDDHSPVDDALRITRGGQCECLGHPDRLRLLLEPIRPCPKHAPVCLAAFRKLRNQIDRTDHCGVVLHDFYEPLAGHHL